MKLERTFSTVALRVQTNWRSLCNWSDSKNSFHFIDERIDCYLWNWNFSYDSILTTIQNFDNKSWCAEYKKMLSILFCFIFFELFAFSCTNNLLSSQNSNKRFGALSPFLFKFRRSNTFVKIFSKVSSCYFCFRLKHLHSCFAKIKLHEQHFQPDARDWTIYIA